MKRARGRNSSGNYNYDDIDVPQMLSQRQRNTQSSTYSSRTNTAVRKKKKNVKKKRKNNAPKVLILFILAALAAFFIAMGVNWNNGGDDEGALIPVDMEKGKLNVLLLGVDKEGLRTDAMMLVSYDLNETKANLISIPRDTQIKVTDRNVTRKINEVHAMHDEKGNLIGPLGSVKAVSALTSVPIHYYVEFNFDAIDELAKIVGGVKFDVPDIEGNGQGMNYDDPAQDLHIHLKPGLQTLEGNQVQQFLRYRKSNSNTKDGSDTSRVARQQEFLKAVIEQKVNIALIAKIPSIYSKVKKNMKTNFSTSDMVKYAKYLNGLTSGALSTYSLPGADKKVSKAWYFICDFDATASLIREQFGYDANGLTNQITINDITGTKKVLSADKSQKDKPQDSEIDGDMSSITASDDKGSKEDDTKKETEKEEDTDSKDSQDNDEPAQVNDKKNEAPQKNTHDDSDIIYNHEDVKTQPSPPQQNNEAYYNAEDDNEIIEDTEPEIISLD